MNDSITIAIHIPGLDAWLRRAAAPPIHHSDALDRLEADLATEPVKPAPAPAPAEVPREPAATRGKVKADVMRLLEGRTDLFTVQQAQKALPARNPSSVRTAVALLTNKGLLTKVARGQYRRATAPSAIAAPAATPVAVREEPPPPPGSVTEILARHKVSLDGLNPLCAAAVEIGRTLALRFTLTDLSARVGAEAPVWIARWKQHGWIDTVGAFTYRPTDKFGGKAA